MAQIPKGRLVKSPYIPICRDLGPCHLLFYYCTLPETNPVVWLKKEIIIVIFMAESINGQLGEKPSRERIHILPKREVGKILDSNMPAGWGYVSFFPGIFTLPETNSKST